MFHSMSLVKVPLLPFEIFNPLIPLYYPMRYLAQHPEQVHNWRSSLLTIWEIVEKEQDYYI